MKHPALAGLFRSVLLQSGFDFRQRRDQRFTHNLQASRRDVVDAKAAAPRFETSFVASQAGAQDTKASVDFFICSDAACVKQEKIVNIPVTVK